MLLSLFRFLCPMVAVVLLVVAGGVLLLVSPQAALAASEPALHTDKEFSLLWVLPFVGILLSIAIWPLARPHFWHKHYGKISLVWALLVLVPLLAYVGFATTRTALLALFFHEYMPFIILLLTLFTLSGGVRIYSRANGTPASNCVLLGVGTILASLVGTTGASMLLIRPLLRANQWRHNRKHMVIFFIFLVSNIGGSLTPLGDPPLFLGFLQGVDFFWTTTHMFLPMIFVAIPLLVIFYFLDRHWFRKEGTPPETPADAAGLRLDGAVNLLLLMVVLGAIIASGIWKDSPHFYLWDVEIHANGLMRDGILLACFVASLSLTAAGIREQNNFTWEPIREVAKLFAGIFIAILPVMAILHKGEAGQLGFLISSVSHEGEPINFAYFWLTGILSAFLDNAPTYLLFFNVAGGDAEVLMGVLAQTLLAISCGAVFLGAMTYIGNAPNLMVRAVAQEWEVPMPSFFGYMAWACVFLVPLFLIMSLVFFVF